MAAFVGIKFLADYRKTIDRTWVAGDVSAWSSIESSFGLVSASLPVLRPLFLKIHDRCNATIFSRTNGTNHSSSYNGSWDIESNSWKPQSATDVFSRHLQIDDEIRLTSVATAEGSSPAGGVESSRIIVRSEFEQSHIFL